MRREPGASNASPGVSATRASLSSAAARSAGRPNAVGREEFGHVGEQVERAGRLDQANARVDRQPLGKVIAAAAILVQHLGDAGLRAAQRRLGRLLADRADVRRRMTLDGVAGPITAAGPSVQPQRQPVMA